MTRNQRALLGVGVVLVAIQAVRPEKTNPPITGDIQVDENVKSLLKRACYDCHSNETKWPWSSNVAPVSWLVAEHVEDGRKHLNFSEWEKYEPGRKKHKLEECEGEVSAGNMPMPGYVALHGEAKLSDTEKQLLLDWARAR